MLLKMERPAWRLISNRTRKKERKYMMNILTDVFANILCRLPVKSLKRFQCVCKSWYELIKNPNFIIQHLHQYSNNKNVSENCLLVTHTTPCRCHPTHLEPADHVNSLYAYNIEEDVSLHLLDLPYRDEKLYLDIFGPCNGIYCLHHLRSIMLVNVALREFQVLPELSIQPHPCSMKNVGFGFDPKTNDYKVVLIVSCGHKEAQTLCFPRQVLVYSSSCNSWRKADDTVPSSVDVSIIKSSINTYVKGNFHWLVAYFVPGDVTAYYRVLCFSMFDEVLCEMSLPSCLTVVQDEEIVYELASYNGSLSLIVYPWKQQEQWFDVWVKQDYDDDDSWTKLLSIGPVTGIFKPMGFWRDGQFLLEDCSGQLVLYGQSTHNIKKNLCFYGLDRYCSQAIFYSESLVSVIDRG
ncbi:hypothetical protein CerSpe_111060 [Prunus speciosa]